MDCLIILDILDSIKKPFTFEAKQNIEMKNSESRKYLKTNKGSFDLSRGGTTWYFVVTWLCGAGDCADIISIEVMAYDC